MSETFKVQWYAATYGGTMEVVADDADHAIAIVRSRIRKQMSLPMYSDGYSIVD
jgi:hypothetical protein